MGKHVRTLRRTRPRRTRRTSAKTSPRDFLTSRQWRAVNHARTRLHALLPNGELKSLVLYGSHVYGKPRPDSDIDLFVVYDDVTAKQEKSLEEFTTDLFGERPLVHVFLYRADEIRRKNDVDPLIYNVSQRGITLEGVPVPKLEINRREVATDLLAKAKDELDTAHLVLNGNKYGGTISHSFYAVLHAADAALASKGFVAKSHEGTETLFGYHFLKPGLVDAEFKGLFHRIRTARLKADYGRKLIFTRADSEYWFERAKEFVMAIEASLPRWLEE